MRRLADISLAILLAVSCASDPLADYNRQEEQKDGYVRLLLEVPESKTFTDGMQVFWEEGDRISVNGLSYDVRFSGSHAYVEIPRAERYEAFYPAEIVSDDGPLMPNVQFFRENSFGQGANPMTASSETETLHFSHLYGVLKLNVSGEAEIASINISDLVTLNCVSKDTGRGVQLSQAGTSFHICLPPYSCTSGMTVTISSVDGRAMVLESSTPREIKAGIILDTPVIEYAPDSRQIFAYHFDAMVLGGDPVGGRDGYKAADSPTGYEICSETEPAANPGTGPMSSSYKVGEAFSFDDSYYASRNLQDFPLLLNVREQWGYIGLGVGGDKRAIFRTPRFASIPEGKVCKAELTFRMAFGEDAIESIQIYPQCEGTGRITGYSIDGVEQVIDKTSLTQWATGDDKAGLGSDSWAFSTEEHLLINPSDFSDRGWHTVTLSLCGVTSVTWINFQALTMNTTATDFYLDDIEAVAVDYECTPESRDKLYPSLMISPYNSISMTRLADQGPALGIRTVDLYFDNSYLYETLGGDRQKWTEMFARQKALLDAAGIGVWGIHLPYDELPGVLEDNITELAANYDVRERAVTHLEDIMTHLAVFQPRFYVAHPVRNKTLSFTGFREYLKKSCESLVAKAQALGGVFCLENVPTTDPLSISASAGNLNWFCSQVPGLGICFDTSHAIVGGRSTAQEFAAALGNNIKTVHLHDGDASSDAHLFPGYEGLYTIHQSTIDWTALMKTLTDVCGYEGPVMYELSTYASDCILSFTAVADNYYSVILPSMI